MFLKRVAVSALLVGLLLIGAAGNAVAKETIRIGASVSWPGYAFYELVRSKNLAPGYDIEILILEDPLAGHGMLAAGQLDIYVSTSDYIPISVENNLDIVNVAFTNLSYGVDQVVLSPATDVSKLEGQKIGAPAAFIGQLLVGVWLEEQKISPNKVTWVNLNADEAVGPMISGDIAAAYIYEPWTTKVKESIEGVSVAAESSQERYTSLGMFGDSIFMNRTFIKEHRKAALDLLRARWDALQMWHDNTAEINAFFAQYLQWPVEDIEYVMGANGKFAVGGLYMNDFNESARFCGALEGAPPFGQKNGGYFDAASDTNDIWLKLGVQKTKQDPSSGIDCSLMAELVQSGYRQSFQATE